MKNKMSGGKKLVTIDNIQIRFSNHSASFITTIIKIFNGYDYDNRQHPDKVFKQNHSGLLFTIIITFQRERASRDANGLFVGLSFDSLAEVSIIVGSIMIMVVMTTVMIRWKALLRKEEILTQLKPI